MFNAFSQAATNTLTYSNPAFEVSASWAYSHPAGYYFWAGFTFVFVAGMFALALQWTRKIIGGSYE